MGATARQLRAGLSFRRLAGRPLEAWRLCASSLGLARALGRHLGGFGQEAGIVCPEHDPAKSDGGLHLRLTERAIRVARMPQRIEEYFGAALEVVLQVRKAAGACLADAEFVGMFAAGDDDGELHLGLAHLIGLKHRAWGNILCRARAQDAANARGSLFDSRLEQVGQVAPDDCETAAPM